MTTDEMLMQILGKLDEVQTDVAGLKSDVSDLKGDVRGIKLDIENDLVPSNKVALEMLLDHSKRFIKLDDKVRNISDSLAINEVLDELKSLHRI